MWRRSHFKQAQYFVRVGGVDVLLLECPTRVCYQVQECPTRVFDKSVLQEFYESMGQKVAWLEFQPARSHCSADEDSLSYKGVGLSCKSLPGECPTRVSYKSVPQECPTRVSCKILQECPTRVSHKSELQECPSKECLTRVFCKSVPQECPSKECPTRVAVELAAL